MSKAVFLVYANPKSASGSFTIDVKPDPGGVSPEEYLHFSSAKSLKEFLHQMNEDPRVEAVWSGSIDREEGFAIKSTHAEWRRLQAWAEENL